MVGDDDKENTPLNSEKKRLNKRLSDEEANVGCAHKKRKCNVLSKDNCDDKKDAQIDSKTNDKLEETSPTEPGPSEVALIPPKRIPKNQILKGSPRFHFIFQPPKTREDFWKILPHKRTRLRLSAVLTPQFAVNSDFILVDDFHKIFLDY